MTAITDKYDFASAGWLTALEQQAQKLLTAANTGPDVAYVYSESFTNPPMARPDGKMAGYILSFNGTTATVRPGVKGDEAATCTVQMDFAAARDTMRVKSGPELAALARQAFADGKMSMQGSLADVPISMNDLHDAMFDLTLLPANA